ncbi:hypothetical protein RQP46_003266 [Phenoliferia psychrophenolica]
MCNEQPCAVCTEPGRQRCSRCKQIRFCSSKHQALLWSSHKVLCTPNAPLVFKQRTLEFAEVASRITSKLAAGPLAEQILFTSDILYGNFYHAFKPSSDTEPKVEAFTLFGVLTKTILCYTEHAQEEGRFDIFEALDDVTRNKFQLQALVLCTLVEKRAAPDEITLAAERLLPIIAGQESDEIFTKGIADFVCSSEDWGERMRS